MPTVIYTLSTNSIITFDFANLTPQNPDIVALNNGNVLFGYGSDTQIGGGSSDIDYLISPYPLNTTGAPQGVLNLTTPGQQSDLSMARLQNGQVVAAYTSTSSGTPTIRYHTLNANGTIAEASDHTIPLLSVSDQPQHASVAANVTTGGFAIAYDSVNGANQGDGRVAFFNAAGASLGVLNLASNLAAFADVKNISLAGLANGNYVAAYQLNSGTGPQVAFQRLTSTGGFVDSAAVTFISGGAQSDVHVAGLPDGGFVLTYTDTAWDAAGSGEDITARVYNADGTPRSTYLRVNASNLASNDGANTSNNQNQPDITVFDNGAFAISWTSLVGSDTDIKTRLFDASGNALTGVESIVFTTNQEAQSSLASLGGSRFVAAWQDTTATNIQAMTASFVRITTGDATEENLIGDSLNDSMSGLGGNDFLSGEALSIAGITFGSGTFNRLSNTNNSSLANALDVSNLWTVAANANIGAATAMPHVSIVSPADTGGITHFYKINVTAGQSLIFDVDGGSADMAAELFDPNGVLVARMDDGTTSSGAGGSASGNDPFLEYTASASGFYTIRLGNHGTGTVLDNTLGLSPFAAGNIYTLNVSLLSTSGSSADTLSGGDGSDTLSGGASDDVLTGGLNDDVLIGGDGNDTFVFNSGEFVSGEIIDGGAGTDRIQVNANTDFSGSALRQQPTSIEEIHLAGASGATFSANQFGSGRISQNAAIISDGGGTANTLTVNMGFSASFSAAGFSFVNWDANDFVAIINTNGLSCNMTGSSRGDSITGANVSDTIDGGLGGDTMTGGNGDDTYTIDNAFDVVIEAAGAGTGNDTVNFAISGQTLFNNVEIGRLIGTAAALTGTANGETLYANATLGSSLNGMSGADTLVGGGGGDTLIGGDGNDFYYVDASDVITEGSGVNSGYDIVIASVNYTLSDNVEQLVIQGAATGGTGGSTANYLYGGNSGLSLNLDGGGGDDVIYAGLAGGNTLTGGSGVDTLLIYGGGIAANQANGGLGSDIYYTYSVNDVLSEAGGDGIDTVYSSHDITLAAGFEQLLLFGSATTATGSADNNIMYGNSTTGAVSLSGLDGADVLIGGNFDDTLVGGAGVDLLFGYGGTNTLIGGDDTDVYYLETAGNTVTETLTGGFDTMYSNVAGVTTLAANVEQLILYGAATGGTGTSGNDYLYANSAAGSVTLDGAGGSDYLLGSAQNDVLVGGAGADQIDLATGGADRVRYNAAGNMGADTVYNFNAAANDLIDLTGQGYAAGSIGGAITIASFAGGTLVTFTSGSLAGTTINLVGVAAANVTAADFVFS